MIHNDKHRLQKLTMMNHARRKCCVLQKLTLRQQHCTRCLPIDSLPIDAFQARRRHLLDSHVCCRLESDDKGCVLLDSNVDTSCCVYCSRRCRCCRCCRCCDESDDNMTIQQEARVASTTPRAGRTLPTRVFQLRLAPTTTTTTRHMSFLYSIFQLRLAPTTTTTTRKVSVLDDSTRQMSVLDEAGGRCQHCL